MSAPHSPPGVAQDKTVNQECDTDRSREDIDHAVAQVQAEPTAVRTNEGESGSDQEPKQESDSVKNTLTRISSEVIKKEQDGIAKQTDDASPRPTIKRSPEQVKEALVSVSREVLNDNTISNETEEGRRHKASMPQSLEEAAHYFSEEESFREESNHDEASAEYEDSRPPLPEEENTKLLRAAFDGDITTARRILSNEFSLSGSDQHGWTALHWSTSRGHYAFTKMLLDMPSNVNARENINDWTPLHIAAINQRFKIAGLLIEYGASKSAKDRWGDRPVDCADRPLKGKRGKLQREMKQLLLSRSKSSTRLNERTE